MADPKKPDFSGLALPEEVWWAVEGDPAKLIELLRSDRPLSRGTRDELAAWLAGDLAPLKPSRGRPNVSDTLPRSWRGHNLRTEIGLAGWDYEQRRRVIRDEGDHKGHPRWSQRLADEVAEVYGINTEAFHDYMSRHRPVRQPVGDYVQRQRTAIARQIRHKKRRPIG